MFTYSHHEHECLGNIGLSVIHFFELFLFCEKPTGRHASLRENNPGIWRTSFHLFVVSQNQHGVKILPTAHQIFGWTSFSEFHPDRILLVALNKLLEEFWFDIWPLFLIKFVEFNYIWAFPGMDLTFNPIFSIGLRFKLKLSLLYPFHNYLWC